MTKHENTSYRLTPGASTIGVIGLGAMGSGIAKSLLRGGFEVIVADLRRDAVATMVAEGAAPAVDLAELAWRCEAI